MNSLDLSNSYYKAVGLLFLALGKAKHAIGGYVRPRTFATTEYAKCIEYDFKIVDEWLEALRQYTDRDASQLAGRRVLELGPGPDFGVPLYLLSKGAAHYSSIDAFPLAVGAPQELHEEIIRRIALIGSTVSVETLRMAVENAANHNGRASTSILRYVVSDSFDISRAFQGEKFDYIFSQAAFEHFDDVDDVIRQISDVANPGARLIVGVDFQTHARWLRDADPLNIYRFSEQTYRFLGFRAMPNRMTPSGYREILNKYGWDQIEFRNTTTVPDEYFDRVKDYLDPAFRRSETKYLWSIVCATRSNLARTE